MPPNSLRKKRNLRIKEGGLYSTSNPKRAKKQPWEGKVLRVRKPSLYSLTKIQAMVNQRALKKQAANDAIFCKKVTVKGRKIGFSADFIYSSLHYHANGNQMPKKDALHLKGLGLISEEGTVTGDGDKVLRGLTDAHRKPYFWAQTPRM